MPAPWYPSNAGFWVTAVFSRMSLGAIESFTGDRCSWVEMGADQDAYIVSGLEVTSGRSAEDRQRVSSGGYRVLQCYTAWPAYTTWRSRVLQSATQGATFFRAWRKAGRSLPLTIPLETARNLFNPFNFGCGFAQQWRLQIAKPSVSGCARLSVLCGKGRHLL
jgi:hypothetical protein